MCCRIPETDFQPRLRPVCEAESESQYVNTAPMQAPSSVHHVAVTSLASTNAANTAVADNTASQEPASVVIGNSHVQVIAWRLCVQC